MSEVGVERRSLRHLLYFNTFDKQQRLLLQRIIFLCNLLISAKQATTGNRIRIPITEPIFPRIPYNGRMGFFSTSSRSLIALEQDSIRDWVDAQKCHDIHLVVYESMEEHLAKYTDKSNTQMENYTKNNE